MIPPIQDAVVPARRTPRPHPYCVFNDTSLFVPPSSPKKKSCRQRETLSVLNMKLRELDAELKEKELMQVIRIERMNLVLWMHEKGLSVEDCEIIMEAL